MFSSFDAEYSSPQMKTPEKTAKKSEGLSPRIKKLMRIALVGVTAFALGTKSGQGTEKETRLPRSAATQEFSTDNTSSALSGPEHPTTLQDEIAQDAAKKEKEKSLESLSLNPINMPDLMKHLFSHPEERTKIILQWQKELVKFPHAPKITLLIGDHKTDTMCNITAEKIACQKSGKHSESIPTEEFLQAFQSAQEPSIQIYWEGTSTGNLPAEAAKIFNQDRQPADQFNSGTPTVINFQLSYNVYSATLVNNEHLIDISPSPNSIGVANQFSPGREPLEAELSVGQENGKVQISNSEFWDSDAPGHPHSWQLDSATQNALQNVITNSYQATFGQ